MTTEPIVEQGLAAGPAGNEVYLGRLVEHLSATTTSRTCASIAPAIHNCI